MPIVHTVMRHFATGPELQFGSSPEVSQECLVPDRMRAGTKVSVNRLFVVHMGSYDHNRQLY